MIIIESEGEKFEMTPEEYQAIIKYEERRPDLFARIPYHAMIRMILMNLRMKKHSPIVQLEIGCE